MDFIKKHADWIPAIIIAIILGGSLPFKFTGSPITDHIFDVVGQFLGLDFFRTSGGYIIGVAELIAVILVLIPRTRGFGGLLTCGIMTGAIFFHLATPLGVTVKYDDAGVPMEDGTLFYTAILAFVCGLILLIRNKNSVLSLVGLGGVKGA
ncbi:MAG: hypothetical protein AB8G18_00245 [Gammaproteobacteria bacterium]